MSDRGDIEIARDLLVKDGITGKCRIKRVLGVAERLARARIMRHWSALKALTYAINERDLTGGEVLGIIEENKAA